MDLILDSDFELQDSDIHFQEMYSPSPNSNVLISKTQGVLTRQVMSQAERSQVSSITGIIF